MSGKRTLIVTLALVLTGLLGACGPGNTIALRHNTGGGEDSQQKSVASSLQQIEEQLKSLERKQALTDARIAELLKKSGLIPGHGDKPAPAVPQGSALGVGFVRPAAGAPSAPAAEAVPSGKASPPPPVPDETTPPATPPPVAPRTGAGCRRQPAAAAVRPAGNRAPGHGQGRPYRPHGRPPGQARGRGQTPAAP